jgi:hypothetical protein
MKTATLLYVGLGLVAGWFWSGEVHRRKNAEAKVDELGKRLDKASFKTLPPEAQLKKMAVVLNDAHKQITAVTKALLKPAQ